MEAKGPRPAQEPDQMAAASASQSCYCLKLPSNMSHVMSAQLEKTAMKKCCVMSESCRMSGRQTENHVFRQKNVFLNSETHLVSDTAQESQEVGCTQGSSRLGAGRSHCMCNPTRLPVLAFHKHQRSRTKDVACSPHGLKKPPDPWPDKPERQQGICPHCAGCCLRLTMKSVYLYAEMP